MLRFAGHSPTRRQRGTAQARSAQLFLMNFIFCIFLAGKSLLTALLLDVWAAKFGGDDDQVGGNGWLSRCNRWVAKLVERVTKLVGYYTMLVEVGGLVGGDGWLIVGDGWLNWRRWEVKLVEMGG